MAQEPRVEWSAVTREAVTSQGRRDQVRKRSVFMELDSSLEREGAEGWVTSSLGPARS